MHLISTGILAMRQSRPRFLPPGVYIPHEERRQLQIQNFFFFFLHQVLIRGREKNQAGEGSDRAEAQTGILGLLLVATGVF